MKRGKFIIVDGGEGSGKSSALLALREKYKEDELILTREPGGTPFAEMVRGITQKSEYKNLSSESFFGLVWSARADHVKTKIAPALSNGINVISDRFDSSTYAYQIFGQGGAHLKDLFWQTREAFLGNIIPDHYIFFDVDPTIGLKRALERGEEKNHFDMEALPFHEKVRSGFHEFLKKVPHTAIDANQPIEKVQEQFIKIISSIIN